MFELDKVAGLVDHEQAGIGHLRDSLLSDILCFSSVEKPIRYEIVLVAKDNQSRLLNIGQVIKNRLVDHAFDAFRNDVTVGVKIRSRAHGNAVGDHEFRIVRHFVEVPGNVLLDLFDGGQFDSSGR